LYPYIDEGIPCLSYGRTLWVPTNLQENGWRKLVLGWNEDHHPGICEEL